MNTVRLAIFVATYGLIAVQQLPGVRLNRPAASLLGAVAMVVVGRLPVHDAYAAIDPDVIVFLLGVLLLTGYLELGGFFNWAAARIVGRTTSPRVLLAMIVATSGLLSALFLNDTICLVFTPLLIPALRALRLRPLPFLLGVAFAANVGSVATITGNPQNMLIGISSHLGYASFFGALALPAAGGLIIVYAVLAFAYRNDLRPTAAGTVVAVDTPLDRALVIKALILFAAALACWLAGLSLPLVAITAGTAMIAIGGRDAAQAFARVEWSLLLFFAALFVLMRGVQDLPLFLDLTSRAAGGLQGYPWHDAVTVSAAMTVLSNLVSNVPAVMLWRPVVPHLPNPKLIWLVMAMSATFAGNLTILGSMANLIVAERASSRDVPMRFGDFLRTGVPITLLTMAWGIATLVLLRA
ncbi:MAG TPA: SLC13 family permease [Gemmatimonadaceae bacterium]|nr:SLC13 family permease [Gemmatimonadaceae bacterium]